MASKLPSMNWSPTPTPTRTMTTTNSRVLPAVLGGGAILATLATIITHGIVARASPSSATKGTASLTTLLETFVLTAISWFFALYVGVSPRFSSQHWRVLFFLTIALCVLAFISSIAAVASLAKLSNQNGWGTRYTNMLIASGFTTGASAAMQLTFFGIHYTMSGAGFETILGRNSDEEGLTSGHARIKSIAYNSTKCLDMKSPNSSLVTSELRSRPPSVCGTPANESFPRIGSIRSSLSHVVRPVSSRTRLLTHRSLSQCSSIRPPSIETTSERRDSAAYEGFDPWDVPTPEVPQRNIALQSSPISGRFLETIPASPTTSRTPSPGNPLDLAPPPKVAQRSRSYSPARARSQRSREANPLLPTEQPTTSECDIHPLFRNSSPTPPPPITAGTMVVAAPDAGIVISDRVMVRAYRETRIRSGSLPTKAKPPCIPARPASPVVKIRDPNTICEEGEGKPTPPIPDFVLAAGARTSLCMYSMRKADKCA